MSEATSNQAAWHGSPSIDESSNHDLPAEVAGEGVEPNPYDEEREDEEDEAISHPERF